MASSPSLEDKFHAAVKAIQRLPTDGTFQPSNEMKLNFYGLYKQATTGPCQEGRPSMFNYINRAKWDAWDKCRSMSKEAAMVAYIDEIRKILETMPQTNEVLEFTQLIGPFYEFVDDRAQENGPVSSMKKKGSHTKVTGSKSTPMKPLMNGTGSDAHDEYPLTQTNGPSRTLVSTSNGPEAPSSPSSSSTSTISSSDIDEFYDDPSDRLPFHPGLSNDEMIPKSENQNNDPTSASPVPSTSASSDTIKLQPHVYGGQDGNNVPTHRSHRGSHHSNQSPTHSSVRHHSSSNGARYSPSSVVSGGGNGRHPNNNYNKETQRAILSALTKLQRDVNNILERLNRLETSSQFLQQRELLTQLQSSQSNSISRWLPLAGLRRRAIAFILLWPFLVFALIRLFLRARIIIRFRKPRP